VNASGLTLDTGALIALERRDRRCIALIDSAVRRDLAVTVPTVCVAEWWRRPRGPAARLLEAFDVEPLTEDLAKRAGEALARIKAPGPSLADAVVMASAAARGDLVLTGDLGDFEKLGRAFPGVRLLRV
jgi:predicted nucleic acid-binding protein